MALIDKKKEDATKEPAESKEVAVKEAAAPPELANPQSVFITNPAFLDAVVDASYGTFTSVTANNGTHMAGEDDLGKVLKFQAIVANELQKVIPGSNDDEAKEFFAVSKDGEFVGDGRTLEEALEDCKEAGYEKAKIKDYTDVICYVVECENKDFEGETVTLQLAPSSQYTWRKLEGKCKMKAALKKLVASPVAGDPDLGTAVIFTSTATPAKFSGNAFTKFVFSMD